MGEPVRVRAEHPQVVVGRHLLELAGEEGVEPQQVRRMPRQEHRQRTQQAHPRARRARLPGRAMDSGQLVGAGRGEHIALAADEFGDSGRIQAQAPYLVGKVSRELCGPLAGQNDGRKRLAQDVGLPVVDDRIDVVELVGVGGSGVVISLGARTVVRIDQRATGPATTGQPLVVGVPDASSMDGERSALVIDQPAQCHELAPMRPFHMIAGRVSFVLGDADPQLLFEVVGGKAPQRGGMIQPLLQRLVVDPRRTVLLALADRVREREEHGKRRRAGWERRDLVGRQVGELLPPQPAGQYEATHRGVRAPSRGRR
ncbi:hypothetical protein SMICM304S_00316 [Streptomyces microflavus]